MKKIQPLTALACLLLCTSVYFIVEKNFFYASLIAVIAYLLAGKEIQTITGPYQIGTLLLADLFLAATVESSPLQFSLISASCVLCNIPFLSRVIFYKKFTMTRFIWFEAIGIGGAIILYLAGNISHTHEELFADWQRWIFPLAPIGFTGGIAFGIFRDTPGLLAAARNGYKVQTGLPAPGFVLPDQNNNPVNISDFKGKRDLLLIFVRGDWCPWCHMMLRTYQKESNRFNEKNILLLAIGPDPVGINKQMAEKLGIEFRILADTGQQIAMLYGCQLSSKEDKNLLSTNPVFKRYEPGIPLPASFLIDKNGTVRYVSRPDRIGEFLDPATIFSALEQL